MPKPPATPGRRIQGAVEPAIAKAVGSGRRRTATDRAGRLLPARLRPLADFGGWRGRVFVGYAALPAGAPAAARPPGSEVNARVNALSGSLPAEAVLLSRAITDTAPLAGDGGNPTLTDVLERYLPESISAYEVSTRRGRKDSAEDLLMTQLRLLHTVALNVEQAEAEHNERDLQIQDRFLRERFANLTPGDLDLRDRVPPTPSLRTIDAPARGRAKSVTPDARAFLDPDGTPVVLFKRTTGGAWDITLRLALPKGHATVLGMVEETAAGATMFAHKASRRLFGSRRPTGFRAPQVDLSLPIKLLAPKRFMIYAQSEMGREVTESVLFLRTDNGSQAELPTGLTNHPRAALTVIASAYDTPDGLMVRNESVVYPDLRTACGAFGYANITWLDRHTPIV